MLSDTLYRVPRLPGLSVIQSRGPGRSRELTSRRLVLEIGQSARYENSNEETVLVLQEGAGALESAGRRWDVSRPGVFAERATALYLPAGAELKVTAASPMEAILLSTPAPPRAGAEPVLVTPAEVRVNVRGKGHYLREVHDLFVDDPYVARLMVGETFNPPGNWSSYPPHKHDGADGEPRLEEVYHFRIEPSHGFAHQSLYTSAGECVTHQVKDGDAVLLPYGYHPVSAPPGYRVYYLWALAGDQRRLVPYEDPQHRWIHDAANGPEEIAVASASRRTSSDPAEAGRHRRRDFFTPVTSNFATPWKTRRPDEGEVSMRPISRREFVAGVGATAALAALPLRNPSMSFSVSVLSDEISQDFGRALEVASKEFGLGYVDLREVNKKNIMNWDAKEVAEVRRLLERFQVRVACIASPIFKVDWPGAPRSKFSPKNAEFGAAFTYEQQDELLERAFDLARTFNTDRIRIFDFWRLEDQEPHRRAIDAKVREAAVKAGKRGLILVVENEMACNTATGAEAARLLAAVTEPSLMLNWDPGNAAHRDEVPYPDGYARLPKGRIGHLHCKDAVRGVDGKWQWAAMGRGVIDWAGQFRALKQDGYRRAVTLETHWRGAGTPEESSRQSFAGMKELLRKADAS